MQDPRNREKRAISGSRYRRELTITLIHSPKDITRQSVDAGGERSITLDWPLVDQYAGPGTDSRGRTINPLFLQDKGKRERRHQRTGSTSTTPRRREPLGRRTTGGFSALRWYWPTEASGSPLAFGLRGNKTSSQSASFARGRREAMHRALSPDRRVELDRTAPLAPPSLPICLYIGISPPSRPPARQSPRLRKRHERRHETGDRQSGQQYRVPRCLSALPSASRSRRHPVPWPVRHGFRRALIFPARCWASGTIDRGSDQRQPAN
jgi:hypothetical protein